MEIAEIAETAANVAYEKGDYDAAIPLYQACIHQQQQSLGMIISIDAIYSSMEKLATCYSKTRKYDKVIHVNNEC